MARIVFDLDGTLIDSVYDLQAIANALMDEEGLDHVTLDQARDFIGNGVNVFVAKLRRARGIPDTDHDRLLAGFMERYHDAVHLTKPYPDVENALRALVQQGHDLGICTNKPLAPCKAVLAHLGLDRYFRTVWGGDSLPVHKPDPAPLNAAFEALPDGPELYVGDSDVDAETAQRAMVPFLLFTEGYRKSAVEQMPHTATFSDFANLPALVGRMLAETV
jgi:phosphoglycolate phosphatase